MPEGITLKRIIDMDEAAELTSSDYALVDSATGGPKKFALGNELSSLKEEITQSVFEGENFTRGKFLNSNGIISDNNDYCLADFIPVTSGTTVYVAGGAIPDDKPQTWIIEYNSSKTLVDYWGIPKNGNSRSIELSANTSFVRFSFLNGNETRLTQNDVVIWKPISHGLEEVKGNVELISNELEESLGIINTTFYAGLATASGTIDVSAPTYTNATEMISFPIDTIITAQNGFRFFVHLFNNDGTYNRTVGWQTASYTVLANQKFMLNVALNPENTAYNSKENEFRLGVRIGRRYNQWVGKNWYAFGTSISDTSFPMPYELPGYTGKYPPYLAEYSGLIHTNYAIAGSRISNAATADRTTILQKIQSVDLTNADLITIDLPINDFAVGSIGTLENLTPENADDTTFYGAMFLAITYCLENSNAVVCLITDNTGKLWTTPNGTVHPIDRRPWIKDGNGKTQDDYCDAMRKIATYLGCYCIDAGSMASINYCHPEYLQDNIHQSMSGGKQYANVIWSILKDIKPNVART